MVTYVTGLYIGLMIMKRQVKVLISDLGLYLYLMKGGLKK